MNKFALVIIGIVAAMAILIALPSVSQPVAGDLEIDYSKQRLSKIGDDFVAISFLKESAACRRPF